MEVLFDDKDLADRRKRKGKFSDCYKQIERKLEQFLAVDNLEQFERDFPQARCHEYSGADRGTYSVDISGNRRLRFRPSTEPPKKMTKELIKHKLHPSPLWESLPLTNPDTAMTTKTKKTYFCNPDWEPIPPGETIVELLEYHGLSQRNLAERTGYSAKQVNQIILGKAPITPEFAVMLERVLGTSAETWNRLEANYQTRKQNWQEQERLLEEKKLLNLPVIAELKRRKIVSGSDAAAEVDSVLRFYGVGNVAALHKICTKSLQAALRHSPTLASNPMALTAWLRLAELQAASIESQPFDKRKFQDALQKIRALTVLKPEMFIPKMVKLCADAGVALVFVQELPGIAASGAAKWLTSAKAVIALNLRGKKNDLFWFSFFHESAHILFDGKKELVIEPDGSHDNSESEIQADHFASTLLIPPEHESVLPSLKSERDVRAFASKLGIAPGIVVGRIQHDKIIPFKWLNGIKETFVWKD